MKKQKYILLTKFNKILIVMFVSFFNFNVIAKCEDAILSENTAYYQIIEECTNLIQKYPNTEVLYIYRALAKDKNKNYPEAITDYSTVIRLNPNNLYAYYARGLAKLKIQDYFGAV